MQSDITCGGLTHLRRNAIVSSFLLVGALFGQTPTGQSVPRAWDSQALKDWATPLAAARTSPHYFSEEEYYRAPVDNYRTYPVYDPDHEPPGYWEELKRKKPEPLISLGSIRPTFDWVAAGKRVWDEIDVPFFRLYDAESISMARSAKYIRENIHRLVPRPDGTLALYRWVVTPKGVALSITACSSCHTRFLDDQKQTAIAGAGFFGKRVNDALLDRMGDELLRQSYTGDKLPMALYRQFGVPWITNDIHAKLKKMPEEEIAGMFAAQIAGVVDRPNGSPFYITKVPDLIGFRDRKYIDHTATHRHRGPGDLMRYAALVEYSDTMEFGAHKMLSAAQRKMRTRWPDEVLYALSQYIYSLQPPANPNPRDELSEAGARVFEKVGCSGCHARPLYTNNKVTLAVGFKPASDHPLTNDILPVSVGTDPSVALKTRKGTGFYKIPSLQGVWYRGLLSHDGSVSTLEDWFDPARLRKDYRPTGFAGVGISSRAVPGHEFGLMLSVQDKKALIAFLRTL
jgi:hypothetical protein